MRSALQTAMVVALVVSVSVGYVRLSRSKGYAIRAGTTVPDFRLPAIRGGDAQLSTFRGKVVVLNFWATWCPPCVAEMPSIERLHRALGPEGLVVLAASTDEDRSDLDGFVTTHGLTLPILRDPGGQVASDRYHTTGYPETFVIDRSGVLVQHVIGPADWDTPQALAYLRGLLRQPSTPPLR